MNRIIILPMILIFCFAMTGCGKSASERMYDRAVKDADKYYEKAVDDYDRHYEKAMDDYNREYKKAMQEYGY